MKKAIRLPTERVPILPLRNTLLFPGQVIPIVVGRARSVKAVEQALGSEKWLLLLAQKTDVGDREPAVEDLHHVGVLARIENIIGEGASRSYQLVLSGVQRYSAKNISDENGVWLAEGEFLDDRLDLEPETADSLMQNMKSLAREIFSFLPPAMSQFAQVVDNINDPVLLSHTVAQHIDAKLARKQELLELISVKDRFLKLLEMMVKLREELRLQHEVQQKVQSKIGKQQREAMLREQIRTLQDELGEGKVVQSKEYREKIKQAGMPAEAEAVAFEQLSRLEMLGNASPETHVVRNYLDLLIAMPWNKSSEGEIDLERAKGVLEEDHYGLEKIKSRIIQHLAVMKLRKDKKGSILLLVGPPGIGKTSLARSIARALGREYIRVSLGGVRDDADVRGHRRTYVGALPGRIIDGIKRAGTNNPVFVLDEVDKMGRGWGGDPASAMLEVLDPEQNAHFTDHYLDVPFDLSRVFFVATANSLETIPPPLRDRMEIIELTGYTTAEKLQIARRHLLPKQLEEHGLTTEQVELDDKILELLITSYTREAGVRELQRVIASVMRAAAARVLDQKEPLPLRPTPADIEEALGAEKFQHEVAERKPEPGVVTGLAWTPLGGDILFVESRMMAGKGQLTLTGQLGEVMKESAQIAYSQVRSRLGAYVPKIKFDAIDIHLHVPAGAIPKDGPSAGVTMLVALASMVVDLPVDTKLAMTGEITLRGAVTPVGGIKEKVIAAHRAGIERVILPRRNERDLREVPEEVRAALKFTFVETIEELLKASLGIEIITPQTPSAGFDRPVNFA